MPFPAILVTPTIHLSLFGIVFTSIGAAIALALIVSGGEIKLDQNGFRAKLWPVGKGIQELRKAFEKKEKKKEEG